MLRRSRIRILLPLCVALASRGLPAQAQTASPAWTRGTTCYEVFVRSFADSDGDGIGDLRGLTSRLDYINDGNPRSQRDLGAGCIWLMPVAESPSYHGYDVTDYYRVEPDYGSTADFKRLMAEAHRRGIRVIVDMVLNHSSSAHPAFVAALRDTSSPYRQWYRWAATPPDERNPWGERVWHKSPVRDEWYYGLFWSGMPDLNYATPAVEEEAKRIARFWLQEMGVDGFRLDAVPYLVEEGGRIMHAAATHRVLRDYQALVRSVNPQAFTVGEVTDSVGALVAYYPDQLDAYFAFDVADSIMAAVRTGRARGLLAPALQLQARVPAGRSAPFLRNHDQPRTRTDLGGDLAKVRVATVLMLTMPGVPFVYYGEEIGMIGAKPDERIRTPMQWSSARGSGFTRGTPWQRMQDDSMTTTVAAQDRDPASLLQLHRRLIHLRAANGALGAGRLIPLTTSHDAVTAYVRRDGDRMALVIANLSAVPLTEVSLASAAGALPAGRWRLRTLLTDGAAGGDVRIGADGALLNQVPLRRLEPMRAYLLELAPRGR